VPTDLLALLRSIRPEEPRIVLLTGDAGSGKTTLLARLAVAARQAGFRVAGLLSPAVFEGACKTGIDLIDLAGGGRRRLARLRRPGDPPDALVIRWTIDPEALAWGDAILRRLPPCDLLIIDEIGPLEFNGGRGLVSAFDAVDAGRYRLAVPVIRPALLALARERWPGAEVVRVEDCSPPA
jgi:nucleoside-triphosphatase